MRRLQHVALGVLTSVGGYLEAGSLGTALQAGARFEFALLWPIAIGTICIAFLIEMTGRLAAVSHHTVYGAMRKRFGVSFHVWPLGAQLLVDLLVLASELAGASLALSMMTAVSPRLWIFPVLLVVWVLLWRGHVRSDRERRGDARPRHPRLRRRRVEARSVMERRRPRPGTPQPRTRPRAVRVSRGQHSRRDDQPVPRLVLFIRCY
jgi:hypothetical protein